MAFKYCRFFWGIEKGKEKFNTKTVKKNFKVFQPGGIALFKNDSAKYFSQNYTIFLKAAH